MSTLEYVPKLMRGSRVILIEKSHPKNGQYCTVFGALVNPSTLAMHQWYDVRFDDGSYGRFREAVLSPADQSEEK